jgi:DNA-binding response OmpR family regulator
MTSARILIADDDVGLLSMMGRRLSRMGLDHESASDGRQAGRMLGESAFDLLITDINMPGMNGMDLLSQARKTDPNMQVIIITGEASLETAIEAVNKGAFGYLTKPFEHLSIFENTVRRALEYRRLTLDNLRMAAAQKRRGDLLEAEVTDRLLQVGRQDRTIRQILANVPQGILMWRKGRLEALNPEGEKWLAKDTLTWDRPIFNFTRALIEQGTVTESVVRVDEVLAEVRAVKLEGNEAEDRWVIYARQAQEEPTAPGVKPAANLDVLGAMLAEMLPGARSDEERAALVQIGRQIHHLERMRHLATPEPAEAADELDAPGQIGERPA